MPNPNRLALPAVAALAALPALLALAVFGVIETPDSPGYLAYAAQLRHALPTGTALLHESPSPITLFRMGGYPALLAVMQIATPHWRLATVLLQIAALSALSAATFRTALRLDAPRKAALAAALLPATGFAVVVQLCLLTDALYAALAAGAAFLLAARPAAPRTALNAGLMLALATTLREATPFLALAYLPLACLPAASRRLACALLLLAPPFATAAAQVAWNAQRGAGPVLTTSRQTVMVQAVLPLLPRHPDLLATPNTPEDAAFDAAARDTVAQGGYARIDDLHRRLFAEGLDAPAMARAASRLYRRAWLTHPAPMLLATVENLRHEFLALPFQPLDTVGALMVYAGRPRPDFDRVGTEWTALRQGHATALLWIATALATRLLGTLVACTAIAAPWLPATRRTLAPDTLRRLRGLWLVCAGLVALYAPVHLEPRYLVPAVPLACVIAACAVPGRKQGWALPRPAKGPPLQAWGPFDPLT